MVLSIVLNRADACGVSCFFEEGTVGDEGGDNVEAEEEATAVAAGDEVEAEATTGEGFEGVFPSRLGAEEDVVRALGEGVEEAGLVGSREMI